MKQYSEYRFGDMTVTWWLDEQNHMGMTLIPARMKDQVREHQYALENLVQIHARGDQLPNGYGNGHTMATTTATDRMRFVNQVKEGNTVVTELADENGRTVFHTLKWEEGLEALRVSVRFENRTGKPVTLDLLSSLNFGGITPFADGDAHGTLLLHRAGSAWSAEGRLITDTIEEAMLERSWTGHALRVVKFGQVGSMPVRGWFPFAAVEDTANDVTWAMQIACPSSWQMEIRRKDDRLNMMASLPDDDFGQWAKTVAPGESFETPEAYVTVGRGGIDRVSQRLLTVHRANMPRPDAELPVLFNEYCTTWGDPSHENLTKIADRIQGHGIDFLVIDAGWYRREGVAWHECGGDWIPEEKNMFPQGLKATADMIRAHGMIPGIWFEPETCAKGAEIFRKVEMLLTRRGTVIDTDNRRFMDLRKPEVQAYLDERVIGLLKKCGFGYTKIDYNDCIGAGCDDPDSLGEGLRQNMQAMLEFFRRMRREIPELWIENCSSGGHRLEPSLMGVTDMASFSDAHECDEIPIIAAQLHRLILPGQSQIWAALRASDSIRRINYSLINTFLGVMCISGDVWELSEEQWAKVDEGISFFKEVRNIIRDGVSAFYGDVSQSWRHPEGWQAVCRTAGGETLTVVHTFGGDLPEKVTLPVSGKRILRVMNSEDNKIALENGRLTVELKAPFEAIAIHTGD